MSSSIPVQPSSSADRAATTNHPDELDDFGLPKKAAPNRRPPPPDSSDSEDDDALFHDAEATAGSVDVAGAPQPKQNALDNNTSTGKEPTVDKHSTPKSDNGQNQSDPAPPPSEMMGEQVSHPDPKTEPPPESRSHKSPSDEAQNPPTDSADVPNAAPEPVAVKPDSAARNDTDPSPESPTTKREPKSVGPTVSQWSHQKAVTKDDSDDEEEEVQWQSMPAIDEFDIYDDHGRLVAKGTKEEKEDSNPYANLGGAGKGYTRVQLDEDAKSVTSLDDDTDYLFRSGPKADTANPDHLGDIDEEAEQRDALSQLEATKDLLTEGQRIAYVGVVRLTIHKMFQALGDMEKTRGARKEIGKALEDMDKWGQTMMVRLYAHMDISPDEQIMIEQLANHGVQPSDLSAPLMHNAKIVNPMASKQTVDRTPNSGNFRDSRASLASSKTTDSLKEVKDGEEVPEVHGPADMPSTSQIELDIRWTVLCDLFLTLISDSVYDARSRRLLERVGSTLEISWIQICRFEKRVIDSLEMQEEEVKENWDETDNMERRRKLGLKRKYMVMGLATVGGGLVIGLSAGLLAPVIGAGLAAGFTTIGVGGTAGFLGGVGGAALITSGATLAGGTIAVRASDRRTGHVQTFEYRPLHNNKRLNLILTVAGWMNGKVDDVRLPYSTVDPIMGDIYSLLWEPEMLRSMGETINILATEALTQTVQQVLGSTLLVALMASIQIPIILTKLAYLIDNPWSVSLDRANAAGLILADSLADRHLGQRPITLVGFSLGSRVIFAALKELSARGKYGLIQNVYLFGTPVVYKKDEYLRARSVVSGRFLNGYASNDWILGYLFRATSGGIMRVAGLAPVEGIPGIENLDVSKFVNGHMAYRAAMPRLMREVGWEVESDEFTEIEDPDPDNHAERQRELIKEIDAARKQAEEKPEKRRFGLFKRGKLAEKQGWETYNSKENGHRRSASLTGPDGSNDEGPNVLFDIDAIRKELESEMIEVRELNSTLPPMQITSYSDGEKHVEYLRLPSDIKADELARMNLPPRPDEIEVGFAPPARTSSLRPMSRAYSPQRTAHFTPESSPRHTPQRSLNASPIPNSRFSRDYTETQGVSTVTKASPLPQNHSPKLDSWTTPYNPRPDLKSHATEPTPNAWDRPTLNSGNNVTPSFAALDLNHNAWADDDYDDFGQKKGNVSMTFE
ncbi:hypothetical protein B0A52_05462 [Exophiala mesophila]|uniref:DUF726 domain protein n=1 Tax=Exophiala mesophila TaxID=212818 RepID=A0A438N5A2_EXOME|nr:hypothetical protein B0A52_05462 [Exophiala mesophila]